MKNVYVILVKSLTRIGTFTRYPYSHASLSLDDDLEQFYSFSRYYYNSPIISGFTSEYRSHLAAKQNKVTECKIFKIPVTDEEYKIIKERIQKMIKDQELMYNYFSLLTMIFRRSVSVYKSYTCTSFVAETISLIDKIKLPKPASRFVPKDFEKLLNDKYAFFEGKLEPKKVFKKIIIIIRYQLLNVFQEVYVQLVNRFIAYYLVNRENILITTKYMLIQKK